MKRFLLPALVALLVGWNLIPTAPALAASSVTVTPAAVAPGGTLTISGSGYTAGAYYVVTINTSPPITVSTVAGTTGGLGLQIPVPASTPVGTYTVGVSSHGAPLASTSFQVTGPQLTLIPATLPAGATLKVQGSGFGANETIQISYTAKLTTGGTALEAATITADSAGSFAQSSVPVPSTVAPGSYTVTATGASTHKTASAQLNVVQVTVTPATVAPGGSVTVEGVGFAPDTALTISLPVTVTGSSTPQTITSPVTVSHQGTFTTTLIIPANAASSTYPVHVVPSPGATDWMQAALVVAGPASITLTPASASGGATVTVTGQRFAPNTAVTVSAPIPLSSGASATVTGTATTDSSGAFTAQLLLPVNALPGPITVTASQPHSGSTITASGSLTLTNPHVVIQVSPTAILPGQRVTVAGAGFGPNASIGVSAVVSLYGGGSRTLTAAGHSDGAGAFSLTLTVPLRAAAGVLTITASSPNARASAQLRVQSLALHVGVSPTTVVAGGQLSVTGSGYPANDRIDLSLPVTLTNGARSTVTTSATANASGQFSAILQVPTNAVPGTYALRTTSEASRRVRMAQVTVGGHPTITVQPAAALPGQTVTIAGSGFSAGVRITVSIVARLLTGAPQTLTAPAQTGPHGRFTTAMRIPTDVTAGTYTVTAAGAFSGRILTTRLSIVKLSPSLVVSPTSATPGAQMTVTGFGFAGGATVTISLNGQTLGSAPTNATGQFTVRVSVPRGLATGTYSLAATSRAGRVARANLAVNRPVSTHVYFAGFYTGAGYHEYLAFLNPSAIAARVTIAYQPTTGATRTKTITINAHSRYTEDVNADLGVHVSAGATVAADVPIVAERVVYHGWDGADVPGTVSPSTTWYFANGNTSHRYREYLAIQNPNNGPIQVAIHFFPTHHRAFTIYRMVAGHSRTTVKVNTFVHKDAVGATVTSNGPVVVSRSIFIRHGVTSKIGVTSPQNSWYFAAGPQNARARNWIGITNPFNRRSYLTLRAYNSSGQQIGLVRRWLRPYARVGYLINHIAHQSNASVVVGASRGIIAEQTTYVGGMHNASTDTFGVAAPARQWGFAAVNTSTAGHHADLLSLFNPNTAPAPIVLQFMTSSGQTVERTYVVGPRSRQAIDVGSVVPNAQLGIVATSSLPFVALNRGSFTNGLGSMTSRGVHLP